MSKNTHMDLHKVDVSCSGCGRKFSIHTSLNQPVNVEMCSKCHPAYTGEQKVVVTKAIDSFNRRFSAFAIKGEQPKAEDTKTKN